MSLLHAFHDVAADLNTVLVERESTVRNAFLALLTGEHFLQMGSPGVAKSLLVDELHARISGAQKFKLLLNQSTAPDELFGPVDLIQLADAGIYTRRRAGSLTEAHIVFLDEIGRGNSVVRNALLQVMNERTLNELGMPTRSVPLISLFAASNSSLAEDEDLRAFDDRFVIREVVSPIGDDEAFVKMLTAKVHPPQAFLSLDQIQAAQQEVCAVAGSREVLEIIVGLRTACAQEGIAVSPRRWKKALKIAKAEAWLDGASVVEVEHLLCLTSVLWVAPAEERVVQRLVYQAACPLYLTALEAEDAVEDLVKQLPKDDDPTVDQATENALLQIADAFKLLERQINRSSAKNQTKAQASLARIKALHTHVARGLMKRLERLQLVSAK